MSVRDLVYNKLSTAGIAGLVDANNFYDIDLDKTPLAVHVDLTNEKLAYHEAGEYQQDIYIVGKDYSTVTAVEADILAVMQLGENTLDQCFISEIEISRNVGERGRSFEIVISLTISSV